MKLHIVAPDIRAGDAVGNHCLYLAEALQRMGFETALYAKQRDAAPEGVLVQDTETLLAGKALTGDDVLLVNYSTFQPRLQDILDLPGRKIAYFHGVTPVELLLDHDPAAAYWSSRALLQLPLLATRCEKIIANSQWNLAALQQHVPAALPASRLAVIPPITPDMPLFHRHLEDRQHSPHSPLQLLTVGRLAPHKRLDDAIRMTGMLCSSGTPATLTIIGGTTSPDYAGELERLTQTLGLTEAVRFRGHVSDVDLSDAFAQADGLLSASLHEGFCIPVLEAMQLGLPAIIRHGTAASEIAQGACMEFETLDEGVQCLRKLSDPSVVHSMMRNGHTRARALVDAANVSHLVDLLQPT